MGIVYRAEDTKLDRAVAIKVLPASTLGNDSDRARFFREAKAAGALSHPNIATIYGVDEAFLNGDEAGGLLPFIAMEFIDGETLDSVIDAGPLKLDDAIRIAVQVASGLQLAHEKKIVHRDIKAANVMMSSRGAAKILDFGLAQTAQSTKLTQLGSTLGTVSYMSPEQARGEEVDNRTDIFSLGVLLYQMVSGTMPFGDAYEQAVVYSILNQEPEPLTALRTGVPMELERIVNKCLAKEARRRYQHADDLIADLEGVDLSTGVSQTSVTAAGDLQATTATTAPARPAWIWPMISVLAAILASGLTWFVTTSGPRNDLVTVEYMSRITIEPVVEMHPALHPSGDRVVYAAGEPEDKRLYYRLVNGGQPERLIDNSNSDENYPSYSPDGNHIVFESEGTIFTVESLGGTPRPVKRGSPGTGGTINSFPTWSPSGEEVAFVSITDDSRIEVINLETGQTTFSELLRRAHSLSWSPDGKFIAAIRGNMGQAMYGNNIGPTSLVVIRLSDGGIQNINDSGFMVLSPRWSPDSNALFFISNEFGGQDIYKQGISDSGAAEGVMHRVTAGLNLHAIDVSRDGTQIIVSDLNYRQNIYAWPLDVEPYATAKDAEQVTFGDQIIEGVAFSPDTKQMAYDSNARGTSNLYLMSLDGGSPLQVTVTETPKFLFDWSPYSDDLSYHSFVGGVRTVGVVSIDDLQSTALPEHPLHDRYAIWLEDENTMGVSREVGPGIMNLIAFRRNAEGKWSEAETILEGISLGARYSQINDQLVFVRDFSIWIWNRDSGESRLLVETVPMLSAYPMWSGDGKQIYFLAYKERSGTNSGVNPDAYYSVSVDGGPVHKVVDLTGANKTGFFGQVSGNKVYSTRIDVESDLWLLDLSEE